MKNLRQHPLITGTLILTATGLISRTIGFFYRIYLSRLFGEEGMGIYQLLTPVLALSFSVAAAGYQTAISKYVAENTARRNTFRESLSSKSIYKPLFVGLSISLPISLLCTLAVYIASDYIAGSLLMEPRTAPMLRIIAFSIPLSGIHSCINGYFYGVKKTGVPAATQLLEQLIRVGCVYIFSISSTSPITLSAAVLGLVIGEFFSMLVSVFSIYTSYRKDQPVMCLPSKISSLSTSTAKTYQQILGMALPLTANRIILNLLQSVEAVSIPARLRLYGYDTATALSVYGVLTGMAMPMIFFPNALTNSISVLLLPIISEAYALGDISAVKEATMRTVKYCSTMGLLCMGGFLLLGRWIGEFLFNSALAGHFISTLGFICPFMYLDITLGSILQGLGMSGQLFIMNIISLLIRLSFIFLTVPKFGITGYLWGLLASQIVLTALYFACLYYKAKSLRRGTRP